MMSSSSKGETGLNPSNRFGLVWVKRVWFGLNVWVSILSNAICDMLSDKPSMAWNRDDHQYDIGTIEHKGNMLQVSS